MKAVFRVDKPEMVECSMTITMPLSDWEKLRTQILKTEDRVEFPMWHIRQKIDDLVSHARMHFVAPMITPKDGPSEAD